ncbi:cytochrome c556 [Rubricella aquisinus]|uniref:Cytochrome c556 n=1 Tax=Rubricella aquisinus TaxID=2028108 RepID=A0A840X0S8_9RHOB|nr:cytochrome c [Rubricella aquisinus]MBB5516990.1 cytochrome c556 [Rubricella aquisinus]
MTKRAIAGFAALILSTGLVFAHTGATGIVKERMEHMSAVGEATKNIVQTARGRVERDDAALRAAAEAIRFHMQHAMMKFPEGSDGGVSEAAPAIWADPVAFQAEGDALIGLATEFVQTLDAGGDPMALVPQIGRSCQTCHERFRLSKD